MPPPKVNKHIIMSNEQKVIADPNSNEKVVETGTETSQETAEETKVEKPKRTPEEELAYFEGRAKRLRKDLGLEETESKPTKKTAQKSDVDYGQLAFYNSKADSIKIESDSEIEFLQDTMKDTGKSQKDLLSAKWFQAELKERKELQASSDAIPKGQKRTGNSSQDTVDYWLAKGEMPPADNTELRRKYVNAKMAKEQDKGKFYNS